MILIQQTIRCLSILFVSLLLTSCESKQQKPTEVAAVNSEREQIDQAPSKADEKYILFFGNSLTAGYGLEEDESFPSIIQRKLEEEKLEFKVINAGLSGETTADGNARIAWVLKQKIDVFVLELGANDMLRGLDVKSTKDNLANIIKKVKAKYPNIPILLAEMKAAPNMGKDYVTAFDQIYAQLAKEYNATLIPFFLEGVAGEKELNLADGKHPNAEGQKIVAENIMKSLVPVLRKI